MIEELPPLIDLLLKYSCIRMKIPSVVDLFSVIAILHMYFEYIAKSLRFSVISVYRLYCSSSVWPTPIPLDTALKDTSSYKSNNTKPHPPCGKWKNAIGLSTVNKNTTGANLLAIINSVRLI